MATAYHEAGHAVSAHYNRLALKRASIIPGDDSHGHILYQVAESFQPEFNTDLRTRARGEALIIGLLAGHIAEEKRPG